MRVRNRDGTPIDPVPFLVVALLAITIAVSWGPVYLLELGVDLPVAVGISVALAGAAVVVAYHRFVWTSNPTVREEIPAHVRFRKLVYAIVAGGVVLLVLVAFQFL